MAQNESRNFYPIPVNYQSGITLMGHNYKGRNIAEALIFTGVFVIISLYVSYFVIRFNAQITTYIAFAVVLLTFPLFTKGINGTCVTKQIGYAIKSYFHRRVSLYNNKVKTKVTPYIDVVADSQKVLPRDKINELFSKYKKKMNISAATKIDEYSLEEDEYIFIDDEDYEQDGNRKEKRKGGGLRGLFSRKKKAAKNKKEDTVNAA
ncbi:MAG: hypothetical protein IKF80_08145 [Erysipelotrichaceae bacterium]|nr:hypothetical protein [Erysipelotrichaceae bacterium]